MPTSPPSVSTLPPAPVRGQAGFSTATGTFLEALPDWGDELDAAGQVTYDNAVEVAATATEFASAMLVAADAAGFVAKSTSTLTVSAGTKTIHFTAAKPSLAVATYQVAIVLPSDPSVKMIGTIATSDGSDDITVTVVTSGVLGSGTYSEWLIIAGVFLASGATAAEMWAATTDAAAISPQSLSLSAAPQSVAYSATTTLNLNSGQNFILAALTGNTLMAVPSNLKAGKSGVITIPQDATGSRLVTWATGWFFPGGTPGASTAGNAVDLVAYYVEDAVTPKIRAIMSKGYA